MAHLPDPWDLPSEPHQQEPPSTLECCNRTAEYYLRLISDLRSRLALNDQYIHQLLALLPSEDPPPPTASLNLTAERLKRRPSQADEQLLAAATG